MEAKEPSPQVARKEPPPSPTKQTRSDSSPNIVVDSTDLLPEQVDQELFNAVVENDLARISCVLERSPSLNWQNPDHNNETALHVATKARSHLVVALLLGKGAEVHLRDATFKAPINIALEMGDTEMVQLLANKTVASLEQAKLAIGSNSDTSKSPLRKRNSLLQFPAPVVPKLHTSARIHKEEEMRATKQRELLQQTVDFSALHSSPQKAARSSNPTGGSNDSEMSPFHMHFARNSLMSEMMKVSHFQTIRNMFVAVLLVMFVNILVHNWVHKGYLLDFSFWMWAFSGFFPDAVLLWVFMFSMSMSLLPVVKLMANKYIPHSLCFLLYIVIQGVMVFVTTKHHLINGLQPATGFFVFLELTRFAMKMHSYFSVNRELSICKDTGAWSEDPSVQTFPQNVTFDRYHYFLWAPTLVYQTEYPRTEGPIQWRSVIMHFFESAGAVLYVYAIITHTCVPVFPECRIDRASLAVATFKLMLPGTTVALLAFYGFLHCWLNAFAEMTRFADRQFYSDWWNVTSWAMYYRKWNMVVHNFLHRHLFLVCVNRYHLSKTVSMFITFIISALVHEYIISFALGFYKPVMMVLFLVPGIIFIYVSKLGTWGFLNIFMWAMLFIGHGCLFALYSRAWYFAYEHQPRPPFSMSDLINIF